jgi:predicted dehydrogenase
MHSTKRFRLGIIGAGHVARDFHLPGYVKHPDKLELVAICDLSEQAREEVKERFGFERTYADYTDMLDREDLDVVGIFLPPEFNETVCRAVVERGIPILCEKPLSTDYASAKRIVDHARQHSVRLKVNLNYRFFHDVVQAKTDIDSGMIGDPYFFEFREYARWTPGTYGYARWDELPKSREPFWGATEGEARYIWLPKSVHYVDLIRHFTASEISDVYVQMGRHGGLEVPGEDFACAILTTTSGVRAFILNHWSSHQSGHRGICLTTETRIQGEEGVIHVASRPPYPEKGEYVVYKDAIEVERVELSSDWPDSFAASMLELVSAIEEDREPISNGEDYLSTQRVIEAGYQSAAENRLVHLDWPAS